MSGFNSGSGPTPKHMSVRARANKHSTRAILVEPDPEDIEIPKLPPHYDIDGKIRGSWHPMAVAWWNDIWPSPMAAEWHSSDIHGLYALLMLWDRFFRCPNEKTHAELRNARRPYGLTPIDRRSLEWSIESVQKVQRQNRRAEEPKPVAAPAPSQDADIRVLFA